MIGLNPAIGSANNQDLSGGEFHPGEVVDEVVGFILFIDIKAGHISWVEFLFIQCSLWYFLLGTIFPHHFQ